MGLIDYTVKLLGLSEVIHKWRDAMRRMDADDREKIAVYCETIAENVAQAARSFEVLRKDETDKAARREAVLAFGRMAGHVEDIATALADHLDGRKIAGVKRRLDILLDQHRMDDAIARADSGRIARLHEAEGYFRSVADRLRA